ncbi:hypothetical protein [Kordiimonas marina]|uniref:hypothetical protein n=1 Tax=Kordiimonas marina TaxID=2872312 RepID=UPI001FF65426|nr:hypothetical protein [Kordiimonas marina]MCJ9428516.1 hypothetical protein [Kordiimonas marina]
MDVLLCRMRPVLPTPLLIIGARFGARLFVASEEKEVRRLLKPSNIELVIMDTALKAETLAKLVKASFESRSIASIHISANKGGEAGFEDFVDRTLTVFSLLRAPVPVPEAVTGGENMPEEEEISDDQPEKPLPNAEGGGKEDS